MHGCPADEIETIGEYLIENKKLHTAIKLNPTLLGKEKLHEILKNQALKLRFLTLLLSMTLSILMHYKSLIIFNKKQIK